MGALLHPHIKNLTGFNGYLCNNPDISRPASLCDRLVFVKIGRRASFNPARVSPSFLLRMVKFIRICQVYTLNLLGEAGFRLV